MLPYGMDTALCIILFTVLGVKLYFYFLKALNLKKSRNGYENTINIDTLNRFNKSAYPWLSGKTCLVTGGNGFLGKHLVRQLIEMDCQVVVFDLFSPSEPMEHVTFVQGNLCEKDDVQQVCGMNIDIVFHCATPNPLSPNAELLYQVNVEGTRNLLTACTANNIERLVFVSSASVIFDGIDQKEATEKTPYPAIFRDPYSMTKAKAEALVLQQYHKEIDTVDQVNIRTVSIRPHSIYGPGDQHFFPTLVDNARRGKTKFQIGDGSNIVDFTYVGNVVHAMLLAGDQLEEGSCICGKSYLITNDEPMPFWKMMSQILVGLGYEPPYLALPYSLCYYGALMVESVLWMLDVLVNIKRQSTFTPSKVQLAGLHHYYSCDLAKKELGYKPLWNTEEGLALSFASCPELRKDGVAKTQPSVASHEGKDKVKSNVYTKEEVAKHNTREDAWFIVKDRVYDITEYVDDHPGSDAILNDVGGDATEGVYGPQHPPTVFDHLEFYYIGDLAPADSA